MNGKLSRTADPFQLGTTGLGKDVDVNLKSFDFSVTVLISKCTGYS
jgi:hypothetical protein